MDNKIGPVLFIGLGILLFVFTVNGTMANLIKAAQGGQPVNPVDNASSAGSNLGGAAGGAVQVPQPGGGFGGGNQLPNDGTGGQIGYSGNAAQTNYVAPGVGATVTPTASYLPNVGDWNSALAALNLSNLQAMGIAQPSQVTYA